ncbi:MAG: hypothetical protein OXC94_00605 [Chloroflexi bacterium]|nr:hypothetical protein [Chloroflexota bacterium]
MVSRRARRSLLPLWAALALSAALAGCLLEPIEEPPGAPPHAATPVSPAVTPAAAASAERDVACALTASGELFCWDGDDAGEAIVLPGRYIAIETVGGRTCAVTEGGDSVCWGAGAPGPGARR